MAEEPTIMRCLGQAAGEIAKAIRTPVPAKTVEVARRVEEAEVDGACLRRTVIDEVVLPDASAASESKDQPCD